MEIYNIDGLYVMTLYNLILRSMTVIIVSSNFIYN